LYLIKHRDNSQFVSSDNATRSPNKLKVRFSLFLIKYHAVKTYGEVKVHLHAFVTSALDRGEWSVSHHCSFAPGERAFGLKFKIMISCGYV
jgi:hypothetical protein